MNYRMGAWGNLVEPQPLSHCLYLRFLFLKSEEEATFLTTWGQPSQLLQTSFTTAERILMS